MGLGQLSLVLPTYPSKNNFLGIQDVNYYAMLVAVSHLKSDVRGRQDSHGQTAQQNERHLH